MIDADQKMASSLHHHSHSYAERDPPLPLVAADDTLPLRVITLMLHRFGHVGVVVNDGSKTLACLTRRIFDVVLLDVMMPTLDGIATLAAIRRSEALHRQPARQCNIKVTGRAEPRDTARLLKAGTYGHITKPINTSQFEAKFASVRSMRRNTAIRLMSDKASSFTVVVHSSPPTSADVFRTFSVLFSWA